MKRKPERTGDLAAGIETADDRDVAAVFAAAFLLGTALVVAIVVSRARSAHKAERAEWAFMCQQMEFERDDARARFTAGADGVTDEEAGA